MKAIVTSLLGGLVGFGLAGALALPANAATARIGSIYTTLDVKDCITIESSTEEAGWYKGRCAGSAGYRLDLLEGDIRQSLNVITPANKEFPLELWTTVSGGFSALGNKAEWRVKKVGGKTVPIALIVRYNVNEDPDKPEKTTSYLVVSKITTDDVCVTNVVKPSSNANVQARKLADAAAGKPCISGETGASRTLEGVIVSYECGDNCYLRIKDAEGKEHDGLCTAGLCDAWNEVTEMPSSFLGKSVHIHVGTGEQIDGSGNVMGEMDAFDQIELLDNDAGAENKQEPTKNVAATPRYLCEANEQVVFGCNSKNKMMSLCASSAITQSSGYLQYRFGAPGKIELRYPAKQVPPKGNFWHSFELYTGGHSDRIRFENNKVQYIVFEDMISNGPASVEKEVHQGVGILIPGKKVTTRLCDGSGSLSDGSATARGFVFDQTKIDLADVMDKEDFNFDLELN